MKTVFRTRFTLGFAVTAAVFVSACATTPVVVEPVKQYDENGCLIDPLHPCPPVKPKPPPEPTADERAQKAKEAFAQKNYAAVRENLEKAIIKEPENVEYELLLAQAFDFDGKFDEATAHYKRVLELDPKNEIALLNLGKVYRRRDQYDAGIALYTKALESDPENIKMRTNLGVLYRLAKKYDDSEKTLRRVLARNPGNIDAYKNMAVLFLDQDKLVLAEQFSIEAKKINDKDAGIWNNLGLIYFKQDAGKPSRALGAFKEALKLEPENLTAHQNIGSIALRYRDYKTAEESFEKALKSDPNSYELHLAYAYALDGNKKFPEALAEYDKVTALRGGEIAEVLFSKGKAYAATKQWQNVKETFEKYLAAQDKDPKRVPEAEKQLKSAAYYLKQPAATATPAPAPTPAPEAPKAAEPAPQAPKAAEPAPEAPKAAEPAPVATPAPVAAPAPAPAPAATP